MSRDSEGSPATPVATTSAGNTTPGDALPGGTVTFLFTDIEGSTRLAARLGERYADVLAGIGGCRERCRTDGAGAAASVGVKLMPSTVVQVGSRLTRHDLARGTFSTERDAR